MGEQKATSKAAEAGNLLAPVDPFAKRARRGSIASIFEQASNQQPKKDDNEVIVDEKFGPPIVENGHFRKAPALKGEVPAEKVKSSAKIAPNKRHRKRRKTLNDAETPQMSTRFAECLEVTQSRWVQDLEEPSREIVTLTGEVTGLDSETLDSSFRWIHYHRENTSISFEDFEKVLDKDQGLYEDEAAVASKCVREAKLLRRTYAQGKYFEPTVHQVSDVMGTEVEKVPVKATFISVPIFALMPRSKESLPYLNRHALRTPARHPIRSLLQYSNILALDTERDKRQVTVVTKLGEDERADTKPFIHVPEFWGLVINMYTVITCAPLSSQVLLGENIQIVQPPTHRQRFIVNFTSLRGTVHDVRCQTWFGLLDAVSKIEWRIEDIHIQLNGRKTEYHLIDQKFRPIDQDRWTKLAEAKGTRRIGVRLVKIPEDTKLTLDFAAKKLLACVNATWVLLSIPYQEAVLEAKIKKALASSKEQREVDHLRLRLDGLAETDRKFRRSRHFNRMLLYAARAHILDPNEDSTAARRAKLRRAFRKVGIASKPAPTAKSDVSSVATQKQEPTFYENRLKVPNISIRPPSFISSLRTSSDSAPQVVVGTSSINQLPPTVYGAAPHADPYPAPIGVETTGSFDPWYGPSIEVQHNSAAIQYTSSSGAQQPVSRPGSSANPGPSLWTLTTDHSALDRVPLTSTEGHVIPAIVDPYSAGHSNLAGTEYLSTVSPLYSRSPQLPRPRSGAGRRHSSFGIAGEVLAPSPLRLPLRAEAYTASNKQPAVQSTPPESRTPEPQPSVAFGGVSRIRFETSFPPDDENGPVTVMEKAAKRVKENVGTRTPFFQWHTGSGHATAVRTRLIRESIGQNTERGDMHDVADSRRGTQAVHPHSVQDILTDVDSFIAHGKYHDPPKFDVSPSDYENVLSRTHAEVLAIVESEVQESARPSFDVGTGDDDDASNACRQFANTKLQLLLGVHGFVECFVNQEQVAAKVLGKIWGIMYNLCQLQLEQETTMPGSIKRETKYVQYAAREVASMEYKCRQLLHMNHQLGAGDGDMNNVSFRVPTPLLAAFRDFVLFLLSTHLAVLEARVNDEAINIVKEKVHLGLHQSQSIFLRMNEHLEMDLDQIGYESISTADSILGLLLENALNISCRESGGIAGDGTEMDIDIVDIYSRYTSNAIDRAKQEASARVYEDIRLLREEIDTISLVLKHQFTFFQRMLGARESALQNLDKRFIYRINTNLDEMIRHFSTLSNYAFQAEFWARNSIEVRSENNNKAIYVFTAVTIIFLPLSFVTGLLGMNTVDVRNLTHGQWLFWATALPFTLAVLIICLCIVNYKFKLKKRVRRFLLKSRVARSFRRTTQNVSAGVKNAYFHGGHAGYGLRLLLPFGLYQRWRMRQTKRKMQLKQYEND